MEKNKYTNKNIEEEWGNGGAQSIDFIVTEDCNLRCKYCYICHKKANHVMEFETAKKFIDYIFSGKFQQSDCVILGFIGGEPFLEVDLIDRIVDYYKIKAYEVGSDWYWNYRINITTNGVNYAQESVQRFIKKNHEKLSVTITIDGTKEKHDLQRVFPDGSGSYDIIVKNIPLYLEQFYETTKVTFSHEDLPLLKESILHLWKLGIKDISANVVYENVWEEGDDKVFENQLKRLAEEIVDNELYRDYKVSLFDEIIGEPLSEEVKLHSSCGAGRMIAVGPSGKIYPCLRYKDYSLESDKQEVVIGNVETGIDFDKVLPFRVATYPTQCDKECLNCEIAMGCSFCQGQSYDSADTATNFQRSKYICKMHKARVRANNYFFNLLYNRKGIERNTNKKYFKKMYFTLGNNFVDFCEYSNRIADSTITKMPIDVIKRGLDYCSEHFFSPVFLHPVDELNMDLFYFGDEYRISHIVSIKFYEQTKNYRDVMYVVDRDTIELLRDDLPYIVFNLSWEDVSKLSEYVIKIFNNTNRINLNMQGKASPESGKIYENELMKINRYLVDCWSESLTTPKEFNKITDIFFVQKQEACGAGVKDFTIGADGRFYVCPFYYTKGIDLIEEHAEELLVKNQRLHTLEYSPLCNVCDARHCAKCSIANIEGTGEVNVPPSYKCYPSLIEYNNSVIFRKMIEEKCPNVQLREIEKLEYSNIFEKYESIYKCDIGFHITNN